MKKVIIIKNFYLLSVIVMTSVQPQILAQDTSHPLKMNLPVSSFTRPNFENFQATLKNGLVAYIVEDHTVPLVSLTALIHAGTVDDDKQGASEALSHTMKHLGTTIMTESEFKKELRDMTAEYQVKNGMEVTEISFTVPAEDTWRALKLLSAILKDPNLSTKSIEALQPLAVHSKLAEGESGTVLYEGSLNMAVERFNAMIFADHPYGTKAGKEDYQRLRIEDVRRFHRTYFVPGNIVLALSGDFDSEKARSVFSENFTDWKAASVPKHRKLPDVKTPKNRHIYSYNTDKLQAWVVLGHELPRIPLQDQAPLQVMNYILGGGHFDTRLFRATRDRRGLTNDDSGFLEPNWRGPGSYNFRTYGRPEVVHLLVELTLKEIERIHTEKVSDEELLIAKNALADGVFQMQFENGHATARTFAEEWLRYGNHEATASYVSRIRALTTKDVLSAAKKYLHPQRMQMVLVGPLDKIHKAYYPEGELRIEDFGQIVTGK